MRHLAGAALLGLAAVVVHRVGHADQQWQYIAVAAALVPQILVDVLAVGDRDRRVRLRVHRRAAVLPMAAAVALGLGAAVTLVSGGSAAVVVAAACATAGLGVAASPVTITFAPARSDARRSTRRNPLA